MSGWSNQMVKVHAISFTTYIYIEILLRGSIMVLLCLICCHLLHNEIVRCFTCVLEHKVRCITNIISNANISSSTLYMFVGIHEGARFKKF
uniref:Uncharacterized protein n=1 Tax=Triticum urartu TaxID=4572 RepID=A0A8R7TUS8_TRIUA